MPCRWLSCALLLLEGGAQLSGALMHGCAMHGLLGWFAVRDDSPSRQLTHCVDAAESTDRCARVRRCAAERRHATHCRRPLWPGGLAAAVGWINDMIAAVCCGDGAYN